MSDDQLYSRYCSGDMASGDALIVKYAGRLTLYLSALVHDLHDAEDLAIDTFAEVMVKKPAIRDGGFPAYVYKAARHRATRFHLRRKRLSAFSLEDVPVAEALAVRPEDAFLQDERRQAVRRCLGRIDPEPREALWLVYCEGLTYAEAAAVLGMNVKRVDNLLSRGKHLLRAELAKEEITDANE